MSLTFRCPECQEFIHVPADVAGLHTHCPSCNVTVPVPDHDCPPDPETDKQLHAKKRWEAVATTMVETPSNVTLAWIVAGIVTALAGGIVLVLVLLSGPGN